MPSAATSWTCATAVMIWSSWGARWSSSASLSAILASRARCATSSRVMDMHAILGARRRHSVSNKALAAVLAAGIAADGRPGRHNGAVAEVLCPVMVGRQAELGALDDALVAALAGAGRMVFVTGEPGIGKSRLARELAGRARAAGATVISGRAVPSGSSTPYRPLTEALLQALRDLRLGDPRRGDLRRGDPR